MVSSKFWQAKLYQSLEPKETSLHASLNIQLRLISPNSIMQCIFYEQYRWTL